MTNQFDFSVEEFFDNAEILDNYEEIKKNNIYEPYLFHHERAAIIGVRSEQLTHGAELRIPIPKDTDDVIPQIVNRCQNLFTTNKDIIAFNSRNENEDAEKIKWNALQPYYYSQKCQNVIKSERLKETP